MILVAQKQKKHKPFLNKHKLGLLEKQQTHKIYETSNQPPPPQGPHLPLSK